MDDELILDLYFKRDEKAIEKTEEKYGKYCYKIAYNILSNREDSIESVNDTYMGAWNAIPPTRPKIFSSFLGRITRNIALKKYIKKTAEKRGGLTVDLCLEELNECILKSDSAEKEFERKELARIIESFLLESPIKERRLFVRRYWYCDSIEDIANRYGYSQSKTKMILFRMREKLAKRLKKEGMSYEA